MAAQRNVQERADLVASASRRRFFGMAKLRNPPAGRRRHQIKKAAARKSRSSLPLENLRRFV